MLLAILNTCSKEELAGEVEEEDTLTEKEERRKKIKNKIMAIGLMARTFNTLRSEREQIAELKNVMGVENLPAGSLALGAEGIKNGTRPLFNTQPSTRLMWQRKQMKRMNAYHR
jgi:serine/threonine-protein phosphatase 2B catalytic subunit